MHKDGFNEDKFKEGLGECVKMIKKTRERKEKLVNLVVPLLSQKTKREIVESGKSCYVILKQPVPSDKYLLKRHLEDTLLDFDQNIHYLDKSEIPAFAKILNKEPLKSFFIGGE